MKIRKRLTAPSLLVAVLAVSSVAGPARAEVPTSDSPSSEAATFADSVGDRFLTNQVDLGLFKSWILVRGGVDAGYIEQVNDADRRSIRVLLTESSSLGRELENEANSRGIRLSIERRRLSLAELDAFAGQVFDSRDALRAEGYELSTVVGVRSDDSDVLVEGRVIAATRSQQEVGERVRVLLASLRSSKTTGVDISFGSTVTPAAGTRMRDDYPFTAGGYMVSGGATCSAGFAVRWQGANRVTTARHCNPLTGFYKARDGAASYSSVLKTSADGAANILNGTGGGKVFDGGWDNADGYSKKVAGLHDSALNDRVCTSGGNSGVHCDVKITATGVYADDGFGRVSTIKGEQLGAGKIAAIQGDSGGPVMTLYGRPDTSSVTATGMIQMIQNGTNVGCGSVRDAGFSLCSKTVLFTSVRTILQYGLGNGATLVTG